MKEKTFKVTISEIHLIREKKFIQKLKEEFQFPSYFGGNLDAVYDCMTDLGWLEYNCFILEIKNRRINNVSNFDYLEILNSINDFWNSEGREDTLKNKKFELIY